MPLFLVCGWPSLRMGNLLIWRANCKWQNHDLHPALLDWKSMSFCCMWIPNLCMPGRGQRGHHREGEERFQRSITPKRFLWILCSKILSIWFLQLQIGTLFFCFVLRPVCLSWAHSSYTHRNVKLIPYLGSSACCICLAKHTTTSVPLHLFPSGDPSSTHQTLRLRTGPWDLTYKHPSVSLQHVLVG